MSIQDDYLDPDRHLWPAEEPEAYAEAWDFLNGIYQQPKGNRDESRIKRDMYKYTDAGTWIEFNETGIKLGSSVEGTDYGADVIELTWKDVPSKFWGSMQIISDQSELIWQWANQPRDYADGKTDAEIGLDWPLL
tara:strand:- start:1110 stop:1514 length:405 start_codon:yes stop_codon:yes gene_type:complete